jgi:beta-glucosidase/6-phospho-beta-glucosidase/beta-galactosidase
VTGLPTRSELARQVEGGAFWWATGIEDTFITAPHAVTGRTLDEYELTGHYSRWLEDLDLMAKLGVPSARYGIPWHRIQPEPNRWEWHHADRPLERMLELCIAPQVDLVHYGLPHWIEGAFLHPDYPQLVAEYATRVADRFKGRIHWYTPLNEPRVTAWYTGRLGWWPPYRRGWRGFAAVLMAVVAGIQRTVAALHDVDPEIVAYHVDATDLFDTDDPTLEEEVQKRRDTVLLPLDLVSGRVDERHPLYLWMRSLGVGAAALEALRSHATPPEIIGLNLYPLFTRKRLLRDGSGRLRIRMPYTEHRLIERVAANYWRHFGAPMTISEVATSGSVERRLNWLHRSVEQVGKVRAAGVPVCGYTWWPMFALITWAWRQGRRDIGDCLLQMGLFDLDADLQRIHTPLVEAYRTLVERGAEPVGTLARRDKSISEGEDHVPQLLSGRV